ncbi:unnamed protein product [Brachionus calyciflorus]|uniref:Orn/DAP/Arg decarboxylase 2 N-terminal domain-containing protein n=1 Tax=Brachionus calyciflorus TaxID=104777 RepID=A0A814EPI2_9BILA|nr:unnamed protein product [Brachionus calyciflorus]
MIQLNLEDSNDKSNGAFYFNSEKVLCTGQIQLTDFLEKHVMNSELPDSEEIILQNINELVPYESKLSTPIYIYSKKRLVYNFLSYKNSFKEELTDQLGFQTNISFSIKANFNPSVLKVFHENGSWASLVNKNELLLALKVGIKGDNLIFNGNGKKLSEIDLAIKSGCYLNIDSLFNLNHTIKVAQKLYQNEDLRNKFPVKLIIRVNQTQNAQVHQYLNTSGDACKFGVQENQVDNLIEIIKSNSNLVKLSGFHSHLGSTIKAVDIYHESVKNLVNLVNMTIENHKIDSLEIINFGGGLGINYERFASNTSKIPKVELKIPTPRDLAKVIGSHVTELKNKNIRIVVEPGRSLVGDSCILLTNLLGLKQNENKNFLVVDSSMCECLRPCLYSAYHHIDYVKPLNQNGPRELVDVVGPVCESGDFLGKDRYLELPLISENENASIYLAIMDVGAYCSSMALNYNLHPKPSEVFIEEDESTNGSKSEVKYILTRRPDTLENILGSFTDFF